MSPSSDAKDFPLSKRENENLTE